jgi:hypothetical protein
MTGKLGGGPPNAKAKGLSGPVRVGMSVLMRRDR